MRYLIAATVALGGLMGLFGTFSTPPAAQDSNTPIPQAVLDEINALLPERDNAGASFLSESFIPVIEFTGPSQLDVLFVWEVAGYRNSLGYFTYSEGPGGITIDSSNLIIPDASLPGAGTLASGDTFALRDENGLVRTFMPGEKVGFFLVSDGWRTEPLVTGWDPLNPTMPSTDPAVNATFGRGCYTSLRELNPETAQGAPELSAHHALIQNTGIAGFMGGASFFISGFEDLNRFNGSDDDFNDLIFIVQGSPSTSVISGVVSSGGAATDTDMDGVLDADDSYPNDSDRALVTRFPASGDHVLVLEDLYPVIGDADYNDAVIAFHYDIVKNAQGQVKDLMGTFALVGRGAGIDHRFGIHFPDIPMGTTGTYAVERFLSDDEMTTESTGLVSLGQLLSNDQRRITVFPTTRTALPITTSDFATNTDTPVVERQAAIARFLMEFDTPIDEADLGTPPYDPYFHLFRGPQPFDVHLPGFPGFADRPLNAPVESGPEAFLDDQGYPWLVHLPSEWRWPVEHLTVWVAYPFFNSWVASGGVDNMDWYDSPNLGVVSLDLQAYMRQVGFTLDLPSQ